MGEDLLNDTDVKKVQIDSDYIFQIEKADKEIEIEDNFIESNEIINETKLESEDISNDKGSIENVKQQLNDIEDFVRDEFKSDFLNAEEKVLENIEYTLKHSSSEKSCISFL